MAENKKSFVLYSDSQGLINQLPDEIAGQLLKHIFAYVNDENPQTDNLLLKIAFEPIKMQLKRDLVKYEDKKEQWSEAGKKSAEARRIKKEQELLSVNNYSTVSTVVNSVPTVSTVNVNVNDNVNDSVNVNDIKEIKETASPFSFYNSLINAGGNVQLVSDWLKVRKNKKATNTQTAYDSFLKEVVKSKLTINQVLTKCVENSWSGFKSEWQPTITTTKTLNDFHYNANGTMKGVL